MKKGIILSLLALVFVGFVVFAIWYINEQEKIGSNSKEAFVPGNSAVVISLGTDVRLSSRIKKVFSAEIRHFKERMLNRVADTLLQKGYASHDARILAIRVEGKGDPVFLYVLANKNILSRGEIVDFLNQTFQGSTNDVRKYGRHKIYSQKSNGEEVYYSIGAGFILVSDSGLYIEDGLKQYDAEDAAQQAIPAYHQAHKYFSVGADVYVYINTTCFTDLLPLFVQMEKISGAPDIIKWFEWGTLDGNIDDRGVCLNGFMHYSGWKDSYMQTLASQQPQVGAIDGGIPSSAVSFGMLNLSHWDGYLAALEQHRYDIGTKDSVLKRKQQLEKLFGGGVEQELNGLLQGEFAVVNMGFDEVREERDGVVMAYLKSGSLCTALLERMLTHYSKADQAKLEDYLKVYGIDREQVCRYYHFPVEDMTSVYWGGLFAGIKNRYVLVQDNYLVFASSETAMKNFMNDCFHRSFIKDQEWYKNLCTKLSVKYNLSYFAKVKPELPYYKSIAGGVWQEYLVSAQERLAFFSTLALQWSNESNMLYNTLFLCTDAVQHDIRPHILWQTKLDAKVSTKPVPVQNHVTGERELFVQDDNHTVYLVNDAGRVLWKKPVDGKINSEVYQVDFYKNGKLQYLFSTPAKIYLIDRNGHPTEHFPIAFPANCDQGITVYDYDNDRNYRIFAPCADRNVYLYGLDGKLVPGWDCRKTDKEIVSPVYYYRVKNKDYIVLADRYRFYILDRKGNERVKVSSVFDLKGNTRIYLTRIKDKMILVFADAAGTVRTVDFDGKVGSVDCGKYSPDYYFNVADTDGDGVNDYIYADSGRLAVYNITGRLLFEKKFEAQDLDFPYVYRFSGSDNRIGLVDRQRNQMIMLAPDGTISKGFPIIGDSPFSIVFSGDSGFSLFAGAGNGSLIKYQVQR